MTQLKAFSLAVPPLAEQHLFVAKFDELMAVCDRLQADLATARDHRARPRHAGAGGAGGGMSPSDHRVA